MNTSDAYDPNDRFDLTPAGAAYLARRDAPRTETPTMHYDPANDPAMNPAMLPEGEPDDDGRDESFTGELAPLEHAPHEARVIRCELPAGIFRIDVAGVTFLPEH